jgi:hypothetical protein
MSSIASRPIDILLGLGKKSSSTRVGHRMHCIEQGVCTDCHASVDKNSLPELELKEFNISGWCKSCQDGFFRSPKQEPLHVPDVKKKNVHKIYINVTFAQKDDAKKLKARWDPNEKSWFTWSNNLNNTLLFIRYSRRVTGVANVVVPEKPETKPEYTTTKEPIYVPEGCVLYEGRIRKERFFDGFGDEI